MPAPRNWRRVAERVGPILLIVVLVVLWEVLTRAFEVPNFLLPTPTDVARLMVAEWPLIQMHSIATIGSILSGYIAAALFALLVSALMIRFPLFERLIMPIFVGLQSVPKIAIAPLILVWVGAGTGSKILVVASIAFFPIVINTMAGFKEIDRGLADVFRSVDASERQMFFRLRLPTRCRISSPACVSQRRSRCSARSSPNGSPPRTGLAIWCFPAASTSTPRARSRRSSRLR